MNRVFTQVVCFSLILLFVSRNSFSGGDYYIDGENAVFDPGLWTLTDNGKTYHGFTQGRGLVVPKIVNDGRRGSKSIAIKLLPKGIRGEMHTDPDYHLKKGNMQRSEIKWIEDTIPFGMEKYIGFSMKLNVPVTWKPTSGDSPFVMQCWQHGPYSPPLSLNLWDDGKGLWLGLFIANKNFYFPHDVNSGGDATDPDWVKNGHTISYFNYRNHIGQWVDIVVGFVFDPDGSDAMIQLWINSKKQPLKNTAGAWDADSTYNDKLGLPNTLLGGGSPGRGRIRVNQSIPEIRFGIYRHHYAADELEIYFDQISLGNSYNDVDPDK